MEPNNNLAVKRSGLIKIMWFITFILLVMTFVTGLGQPILTSTIDRKLDEFSDGQRNKPLYDSWNEHERNLSKIQGYEYKDPREVKQESLLWSWKWGIGFVIFLFASFIYTGFAGISGISSYIKQKTQERKQNGKSTSWAWKAVMYVSIFILVVTLTLIAEYKIGGGILKWIQNLTAGLFDLVKKTVKGVGL